MGQTCPGSFFGAIVMHCVQVYPSEGLESNMFIPRCTRRIVRLQNTIAMPGSTFPNLTATARPIPRRFSSS